jgi:peptidoglycan hydrolase-like protein with peptidoglycan-binding domain
MRRRVRICYLGAVLLVSAAPAVSGAQDQAPAQSTPKKKKTSSKKHKQVLRAQKAPTPDRIREIQSALVREGAYSGNPTGKWDDATVNAMKKYQDAQGLSPTGKIDALTLEKLGLGSATAGKGAPHPLTTPADPPQTPTAPSASSTTAIPSTPDAPVETSH